MSSTSGYLLFSILESTHCIPPKVLDSIQEEMEKNPTQNILPLLISKNLITEEIAENLERFLYSLDKVFPSNKNNHTQKQINPLLLPLEVKKDILFARSALSQGLCNLEQINDCFAIQAQENKKKKLGQVMMTRRVISGDRYIKIQKEVEDKIKYKEIDNIIFEDKMTKVISVEGGLALVETSIPKNFGPYHIVQEIARGGMGVVYKAWDDHLQRIVALKVLKQWECPSVEETQRFQREARLAASLQHPNIVNIYDADIINGVHYFTMDYVEGQVLSTYLKENHLTYRESLKIIRDMALALDYAHSKNVIHRDVKPGNIILDKNSNPQLTDFGLAKAINTDSVFITQSGKTIGTPAYMSPEQARGENIDARSDIYSLGAILYEMITGQPPFSGESFGLVISDVISKDPRKPSKINPYLPNDIEVICLKAMAKEKEHRYTSSQEMAEDINRYLFGENIKAKLNFRILKFFGISKRNVYFLASSFFLLCMCFVILFWTWQKYSLQYQKDVHFFQKTQQFLSQQQFFAAYESALQIQEDKLQQKVQSLFLKIGCQFIDAAQNSLALYKKNDEQSQYLLQILAKSKENNDSSWKKQKQTWEKNRIENYKNIIIAWENLQQSRLLIPSEPRIMSLLREIYEINTAIATNHHNYEHTQWFQNCIDKLDKK